MNGFKNTYELLIDGKYNTGVCVDKRSVGQYVEARFNEPQLINYVYIGKRNGYSPYINGRSFEYMNMDTNKWEEIFTIEGFNNNVKD